MSFWKESTSKFSIICDIGSASVALALVSFEEGAKPTIHASVRIPISIQKVPISKDLETALIRFLEDAFKVLPTELLKKNETKSLIKKIESVHAIYSSPWYVSKTEIIHIKKDKTFHLRPEDIEKIIDEEEKKFETDAITGKYDSLFNKDIKMIERELIKVKLNGYETSNPYQKDVLHADLYVYMSLVPYRILQKVRDLSEKYFHAKNFSHHTFPLTSYDGVKNYFPSELDFILLDIAGEMTDVTLVNNGMIVGSVAFAFGKNHCIREAAKKFGVLPEIALSFIRMSYEGGLEESLASEVNFFLDNYKMIWSENFSFALQKINPSVIPKKTFVTVDQDISQVFLSILNTHVENSSSFSPVEFSETLFAEHLLYEKFVERDPFIALETLFISKHSLHI